MSKPRYLGDGVYVDFDGFGISISVNHHENKVVFLEPEVADNLVKYINETKK